MKPKTITSRISLLLFGAAVLAVVLVACGGGGSTDTSTKAFELSSSTAQKLGVSVTWSPPSVTQSIKPGETKAVTVMLIAKRSTPSAVLRVEPEIAPYVSVSPTTIGALAAGQSVQVTLTFAANVNALPTVATGTVQFRIADDSGNTIAQPLPVQVIVLELINGIIVPPEPPPELNNVTLAGIDSNNNGVRDDVERVIAKKFGGTIDYSFAIAYAQQFQTVIALPTPTQRSGALIIASKISCAVEGAGDSVLSLDMISLVVNTPARQQAYHLYNDVLEGFIPQELPPCI